MTHKPKKPKKQKQWTKKEQAEFNKKHPELKKMLKPKVKADIFIVGNVLPLLPPEELVKFNEEIIGLMKRYKIFYLKYSIFKSWPDNPGKIKFGVPNIPK